MHATHPSQHGAVRTSHPRFRGNDFEHHHAGGENENEDDDDDDDECLDLVSP